jgi:hypothetical protein
MRRKFADSVSSDLLLVYLEFDKIAPECALDCGVTEVYHDSNENRLYSYETVDVEAGTYAVWPGVQGETERSAQQGLDHDVAKADSEGPDRNGQNSSQDVGYPDACLIRIHFRQDGASSPLYLCKC